MFIDPKLDPKELSPLVLAYVGDAVYELYIRTRLAGYPANTNCIKAVKYVQASKQAEIVHRWGLKIEDEDLVRRVEMPRGSSCHGDVVDYRWHRLGSSARYLYLTGQEERLRSF